VTRRAWSSLGFLAGALAAIFGAFLVACIAVDCSLAGGMTGVGLVVVAEAVSARVWGDG
jgi:hypothetical protein